MGIREVENIMTSILVSLSSIMSFVITWALGKKLIPYLHKLKYGQTILEIGPSWHNKKQGTPTMGGIMFIIGITVSSFITLIIYYLMVAPSNIRLQETPAMILKICSGLFMSLAYGLIGFLDDYIKVVKKRNLGLTAVQKLVLQFLIVAAYLFSLYFIKCAYGGISATTTIIPFFGRIDLGIFYWPLAAVLIVGMVNSVNLTDGIDGLSSSVTFFVGTFFLIIAGFLSMMGLSIVIGALMGGCLGFLIFNIHPAKVFMGDTGSLFLGGIICAIAFSMDLPILLPIIGIIYIAEMFSVILQVVYFKITNGKRLFKMSPLHHHCEMCGWSEVKICVVFSFITAIFGAISILIVVFGV